MSDPNLELRYGQVTIKKLEEGKTVDTEREKNRGEEKIKWYYLQVEVKPQTRKVWKFYMHPYGHGLRKKMEKYISHPGRKLMIIGTLLTPPHYQPTR